MNKMEQIAGQIANGVNVKKIWGDIILNVLEVRFAGGADPVGAKDSTAAFQSAVNYAQSNEKKDIWIPPGTYKYTTLENTAGITFYGDGVTLNGTTLLDVVSFRELVVRINNIVAGAGESNTEIIDARQPDGVGAAYATLKERLDTENGQVNIRITNEITDRAAADAAHAGSGTAHPAENITYEGNVVGAASVKEAIDNLKTELNQAVISGDSSVEAAVARSSSSGTVYPTLKDRLDTERDDVVAQLAETMQVFNVKKGYGAKGDGVTDDTAAIHSAIQAASATNGVVFLPSGSYKVTTITLAYDNVTILGAGMPGYDDTTGKLLGGTIIIGKIDCAGKKRIRIKDLGIDGSTTNDDALLSGGAVGVPIYHRYENLALNGAGYAAADHGILMQSGTHITARNIHVFNFFHGIAVRSSYVTVDGVYAYQCTGNSVIVKSATGSDTTQWVNVLNATILGHATDGFKKGGPIRVQSFNDGSLTQYVNIDNVVANFCGEATVIVEQNAGTLSRITVSNVKTSNSGDASSRAAFDVVNATDVVFDNCASDAAVGYAFRNTGGQRIRVKSSSAKSSGVGDYTGTFDYLELDTSVLFSIHDNLNMDKSVAQRVLTHSAIVSGAGSVGAGTTDDILTITWGGATGTYTSMAIEVMITQNSGGHARTSKYRIALSRLGSSALEAAIVEDGTTLVSGAGLAGTLTVSIDTATADTLKISVTGVDYGVEYGYLAQMATDNSGRSLWRYQNTAA